MDISILQDGYAESSIIRILISDITKMADIGDRLSANSFYSYTNQVLFKTLRDLYMDESVDDYGILANLVRRLGQTGELDKCGGISYITEMYKEYANPQSLNTFVESVREMAERRDLWKSCYDNCEKLLDKTKNIDEIKGKMLETINATLDSVTNEMQEGVENAYIQLLSDEQIGLNLGYKTLDNILNGVHGGDLVVLAGRPAMGKTALALNIIANLCRVGKNVQFYSLEMSTEEIGKRLILCEAGISENEIKKQKAKRKNEPNSDNGFWQKLEAGHRRVQAWNLRITEKDVVSVEDIMMDAMASQKIADIDLVVIDYLQLMSAEGFNNNRVAEISHITRNLKLLARRMGIPILVLSQLSRSVEQRQSKKPILSDLRDSGSIEQDADIIMMIYREQYYDEKGDDWTEVNVAKHRQGRVGVARLTFDMEKSRFADYRGIAGESVRGAKKEEVEEVLK